MRYPGRSSKIALVMDLRGKDFLATFPKIFQEVKRKGYIVEVLFLEAMKRF